ncbi:hypothetical protein FGO68_gene2836 [Halteria grandinella]|uniref:Uncharacterized protein n=1 Tax=Halteria grandinella TaxID=5974 RepID=A0A8J8SZ98_HALGN|nr:hypothetical protein FGO68_gene2836 [Halteria grandinella]
MIIHTHSFSTTNQNKDFIKTLMVRKRWKIDQKQAREMRKKVQSLKKEQQRIALRDMLVEESKDLIQSQKFEKCNHDID